MSTINFDDEMSATERWADDHGYVRTKCRIHGSSWSDSGGCDYCDEERITRYLGEEPEADVVAVTHTEPLDGSE